MKTQDEIFFQRLNLKNFIILKYFLRITGAIPCFDISLQNSKLVVLQKVYFVFVSLILATMVILCYYTKMAYWSTTSWLQNFINFSTLSCIALLNVYTTLCVNLWKNGKYKKFELLFAKFDKIMHKYIKKIDTLNTKYLTGIIFWKTIFPTAVCLTHTIYTCLFVSWWFSLETLLRHLMAFKVVMCQHHVQQIGHRYEAIERIVLHSTKRCLDGRLNGAELKKILFDMSKNVAILNDLIRLFNELFGWILFLLTLSVILSTLFYINMTIRFFNSLFIKWGSLFIVWISFHLVSVI